MSAAVVYGLWDIPKILQPFLRQANRHNTPAPIRFTELHTPEDVAALYQPAVASASYASFDCETLTLDPMFGGPEMLQITTLGLQGDHTFITYNKELFKDMLAQYHKVPVSFYMTPFDYRMMVYHGHCTLEDIPWAKIHDLQHLTYLVDPNIPVGSNSLKVITEFFLGYTQPTFADTFGKKGNIYDADKETRDYYAAHDPWSTVLVGAKLHKIFMQLPNYKVFMQLHQHTFQQIFTWEFYDHRWDIPHLRKCEKKIQAEAFKLEGTLLQEYGLSKPNSPKEKVILFNKLGISTGVYSEKTGAMSTSTKLLAFIDHPLCDLLVRYTKVIKLQSTYFGKILQHLDPQDGSEAGLPRLTYKTSHVPTLRFSAGSSPTLKGGGVNTPINQQALPKTDTILRTVGYNQQTQDIVWDPVEMLDGYIYGTVESQNPNTSFRKGWLAMKDDHLVVSADYSGIEIVIAAYLSKEDAWVSAIEEGADLHGRLAARIYGDNYTKDQRRDTKRATFNFCYEGSARSLQQRFNLDPVFAENLYTSWWQAVPNYRRWCDTQHRNARSQGHSVNMFGLVRPLARYYKLGDRRMASFGDRSSVNSPIQSACACMLRFVLCKLWQLEKKYSGQAYFLSTVHDSVSFSVQREVVPQFIKEMIAIMLSVKPKAYSHMQIDVTPDIGYNVAEVFEVSVADDGLLQPSFVDVITDLEVLQKRTAASLEAQKDVNVEVDDDLDED